MNYEEKCPCSGCTLTKIRNAIDEPIPNIEKAITAIFNRSSAEMVYAKSVIPNDIKQRFDKIESLLYNDLDEVRVQLELLDLVIGDYDKKIDYVNERDRFVKGTPKIKREDKIKQRENEYDNMPTIFDRVDQ